MGATRTLSGQQEQDELILGICPSGITAGGLIPRYPATRAIEGLWGPGSPVQAVDSACNQWLYGRASRLREAVFL